VSRNVPRLSEAQWFGLRFFAILGAFSVLAWVISLPQQLGLAQRGLAEAATWLAHLTGGTSRVYEDQIQVAALAIHINHECTGVYVLIILCTFLLAYPARWSARMSGLLIGIVALTVINVVRLSFLVRVAELQPALFSYFHEYVWQGVFLVLVIAYAMSWVEHST
jgi:exosortase/archaeosortase family protein